MSEFQSWKQPIQLQHRNTGHYYRATANQLKPYLYGISPNVKWPAEGLPKVMCDGIVFWVNPLGKKITIDLGWCVQYRREGMHSRLMCACPICDKTVSYGRLHQHLRVHSCPECGDVFKPDFGALSRKDNKTMLCSGCGLKETFSW